MIAEQSAGHHSSDSDVNVDFELHGDGDCQRQENAECAVGGTGCKRNDTTYHKHKERKQGGSKEAASYINDELSGAQRTADVAQAESSNQNDGHIGHLLHAFDDNADSLNEGHDLVFCDHQHAGHGAEKISSCQRHLRLSAGKFLGREAKADEHNNDHAKENNQRNHGNGSLGVGIIKVVIRADIQLCGSVRPGLVLEYGAVLSTSHGAELTTADGHQRNQQQGQNGIQKVRKCLVISRIGILGNINAAELGLNDTGNDGDPSSDGDQHADRRRSGVQNIRQFLSGNLDLIVDGSENGAKNQAVGRVGEENQQTTKPSY